MTTVNYSSGDKTDKPFAEISSSKARIKNIRKYGISKLGYPSNLFIREDKPQRGGGRNGQFRQVKDFFIDKENKIFVGYSKVDPKDTGYQFVQYEAIGRLMVIEKGVI